MNCLPVVHLALRVLHLCMIDDLLSPRLSFVISSTHPSPPSPAHSLQWLWPNHEVTSTAAGIASQLGKLLELRETIQRIGRMPKEEGVRLAKETGRPLQFRHIHVLASGALVLDCKWLCKVDSIR